jgi:hypothetical protein
VQKSELQQYEEQEDDHRSSGIQKVLPVLPEAPRAQGNQVNWG